MKNKNLKQLKEQINFEIDWLLAKVKEPDFKQKENFVLQNLKAIIYSYELRKK